MWDRASGLKEFFGGPVEDDVVVGWQARSAKTRVTHQAELLPCTVAGVLLGSRMRNRRFFTKTAARMGPAPSDNPVSPAALHALESTALSTAVGAKGKRWGKEGTKSKGSAVEMLEGGGSSDQATAPMSVSSDFNPADDIAWYARQWICNSCTLKIKPDPNVR